MVPSTSTTLLRQIGGDVRHARWAEFVTRYSPMCRHYLRRHFPSLETDDILQETFVALAKALPKYHYDPLEKGHFRNYLVGILRNKALMALRKQKRDEEVLADYADDMESRRLGGGTETAALVAAGDDWRNAVFEIALQQLMADPSMSDRTKQIFIRTAIKQEKPDAVATALGVSRNVVDQQKRRTLAKFKALVAALKGVV
ncbi:MAG: sigma-70 family RNA polymerase sigma factor [Kiritimatiellae bacterium]|nr:sigma-70 family RNA polymerase sigma factor [Kiritimatiellia bacterium]